MIVLIVAYITASAIIPLLPISHGFVRAFDFPRLQMAILEAVFLVVLPFVWSGPWLWVGAGLVAAALVQNVWLILPFTPLWRPTAQSADVAQSDRSLSLMAANVKMSNRDYGQLIALLRAEQPDLCAVLEVDDGWADALAVLSDLYSVRVGWAQDNGYGMLLLSRLPLTGTKVEERLTKRVPSIWTEVTLKSGEQIEVQVLHPEPPVPGHWSEGRDAEIGLAGLVAGRSDNPGLILGDLNDVAWSRTTRRFRKLSGYLDPRIGRGIYPTFHADKWYLRWPLDHLFHDPRFRIAGMRRMPHIGSDHFPMRFDLVLTDTPHPAKRRPAPAVEHEVRKEVAEVSASDDPPVGEDWEK